MAGLIHTRNADGYNNTPVSADNPLPIGGGVASGATDAGSPVKVGGVFNSTLPTLTNGQRGDAQLSARGKLLSEVGCVPITHSDASNNAYNTLSGQDNSGVTQALIVRVRPDIFNGSSWDRQKKPNATSRIVSAAASTNGTSAKAAAGDIFAIQGYNAAATVRYLKIYNKASAPTVGTDVPVKTIALAPSSAFNLSFPVGYYCSAGIAYALTTGSADSDTGNLTAGDILGLNIDYA